MKCFSTPNSVGSVQRRRASNSARLGEALRVRLDKARGGLEDQIEHEQLKLDHTKKIFSLIQNLHAARSHQDAVNQVLLKKAQLERELALRLLQHHPPRQ
uniref:Uncharacterized protein n=1 Tax=Timema douglasi TaxID=61478 RepID=A0A7R8VYG3_TIMDO|nr:unnamed protein product [Timema douglasi]